MFNLFKEVSRNLFEIKNEEALSVSTSQCLLATFNLCSFAAESISPKAQTALLAGSLLANATFCQKRELKDQLLFWGGEAFSLVFNESLKKVPEVKAALDIIRVATIAWPCIKSIANAAYHSPQHPASALKCSVVNGIILGSSLYRIQDSIKYAMQAVSNLGSNSNSQCVDQVSASPKLPQNIKPLCQSNSLKEKVDCILNNGGSLKLIGASSGV